MLLITLVVKSSSSVALKLEGSVIGPWVGELRQVCEFHLSKGRELSLDLADVSFADADGVALLVRLNALGTKLSGATPFVEEQLKTGTSPGV
jgi:hypothetical protein